MSGFRFLKIFIVSFTVILAILNGRFLYAQFNYWVTGGPKPAFYQSSSAQPLNKTSLPDNATLIIEKLGVSAPIVFGVERDNDVIFKNLENGVVHYPGTSKPGTKGASIILGHSSAYPWYHGNYGSVFALLGKLEPGDKFHVKYGDGSVFNFEMKQSLVFSPFDDESRLAQLEQTDGSSLVLVSCWPVGTSYKRIAVRAELI